MNASLPNQISADKPHLNTVIIACKVFQTLIQPNILAGNQQPITFLDYGLHRVPKNLTEKLQSVIDSVTEPSIIILGYGLCGNGLSGIKSGRHYLLVPRTDDCIAILLGSYKAYMHQFSSTPGTYYLTKGWLESGSNPLQEYQEYVSRYGEEIADWLMDQQYQHYERLAFVTHSQTDLDLYRAQAMEVAEFCQRWGMRYEEIVGSQEYILSLMETSKQLDSISDDFILIKPGGELHQDQFIRLSL